jgi:hypothetical protein
MEILDLVNYSYEQGKRILEKRKSETLKEYGQFLTPPNTAHYMAKRLGRIRSGATVATAVSPQGYADATSHTRTFP